MYKLIESDNVVSMFGKCWREMTERQSPAFRAKVSRDTSGKPTLEEEARKARTFNPEGDDLPIWKDR